MKCPQPSFLRKAFCLSEQAMHYSSSTFMSNFLHQMMFQRMFLLKKHGKVAARKLYNFLEFFSLIRIYPAQLSNFFLIFLSSHSLHFFSAAPYLQINECLKCLPSLKQFQQRVTSSQWTHLQTVQLEPIYLSSQPSQQQLYSLLPTFLVTSCSLSSYYFCLISRMISGVFQSLQSGHLTTPLFLSSCLAHCMKHSRWKVFLQTVAQEVVASHLTICMWQIAQRLSSSQSSYSSMMTFLLGILILVYLRKSLSLLSWMRRLAMMYLSYLSLQVWRKRRGWSGGMQNISERTQRVWVHWWLLVVAQEHLSSLPMVILNLVPQIFQRMKLVRPVIPTRQNFCIRVSMVLMCQSQSRFVFLLIAFDITKINIIRPHNTFPENILFINQQWSLFQKE